MTANVFTNTQSLTCDVSDRVTECVWGTCVDLSPGYLSEEDMNYDEESSDQDDRETVDDGNVTVDEVCSESSEELSEAESP